jgi:CRP/FNR family cyclic AMP-dependent transcriptional regulator
MPVGVNPDSKTHQPPGQSVIPPPLSEGSTGPLGHIPLFCALGLTEQETILSSMREELIEPNQNIVWHGDAGDSFYLINEGKVAICLANENGDQLVLNYLGRGGFFGEISLFDGGPRTATVRAVEQTRLYVLGRADFHAFIKRHPEAAIEILTVLGRRFRGISEALRTTKNPNQVFEETRTTTWEKFCDWIAKTAASQAFTVFHVAWFLSWIALNELASLSVINPKMAFDPYPFGLLTVVCSLEAIFLAIFVMVSQNRQSQKEKVRNDLEFQVNVKAQTEIMSIARRLENVEDILIKDRQKQEA